MGKLLVELKSSHTWRSLQVALAEVVHLSCVFSSLLYGREKGKRIGFFFNCLHQLELNWLFVLVVLVVVVRRSLAGLH